MNLNTGYHSAVRAVRRSEGDIANRLRSIERDAKWVEEAVLQVLCDEDEVPYPVLPNLRCGAWYVRPEKRAGTCRFKSTDGHYGTWDFSLSRVNVNVLHALEANGVVVIVDATRKGKVYPDALTRTVPIWCAVVNRLKGLRSGKVATSELPKITRTGSELDQIDHRVEGFVEKARECGVRWEEVPLSKPVVCRYVAEAAAAEGDTPLKAIASLSDDVHTLILVSASSPEPPERLSYTYVQGAGDDHQAWAKGLTPEVFWRVLQAGDLNITAPPEDVAAEVEEIVGRGRCEEDGREGVTLLPGTRVAVAVASSGVRADVSFVEEEVEGSREGVCVVVDGRPTTPTSDASQMVCLVRDGSKKDFLKALPLFLQFLQGKLGEGEQTVVLACPTGCGVSAAAAVAVVASFSPTGWEIPLRPPLLPPSPASSHHTKQGLRCILSRLTTYVTTAAPSRNVLKQMNRYFIPEGGHN